MDGVANILLIVVCLGVRAASVSGLADVFIFPCLLPFASDIFFKGLGVSLLQQPLNLCVVFASGKSSQSPSSVSDSVLL